MSVEANARLYIKEIRDQFTAEQLKDWQQKTIGTKRFYAFDHFGSITNDEIPRSCKVYGEGSGM